MTDEATIRSNAGRRSSNIAARMEQTTKQLTFSVIAITFGQRPLACGSRVTGGPA